jgi:hypothetical protein
MRKYALRRLWYFSVLLFYRYLYVPIMGYIDRYRYRNDPEPPPVPCLAWDKGKGT